MISAPPDMHERSFKANNHPSEQVNTMSRSDEGVHLRERILAYARTVYLSQLRPAS